MLGIEFLWITFMNFFVGPTISKKNPTREQIIAMKHNIIITCIKSAISGVTHRRAENVIKNSVNSVQSNHIHSYYFMMVSGLNKGGRKIKRNGRQQVSVMDGGVATVKLGNINF